ncbi:hypothetical protein SLS60_010494 [Paraconiothyrium brasiliense]|uniref:Uncharacterized protein n=1 Tax=Paraconiothyrium brasiliense TaxID=300254 RepID=A0ABR3QNN6_9PLEO
MSTSPSQNPNIPGRFGPPTEQDANLTKSPLTSDPSSPPPMASEDRDLAPQTSPILILRPPKVRSNTHPYTVPDGRPSLTNRNRRGLTINTERPNPFLNSRALTPSPPKSSFGAQTPAESPTTPNSKMIFPMELNRDDGGEESGGEGARDDLAGFVKRVEDEKDDKDDKDEKK